MKKAFAKFLLFAIISLFIIQGCGQQQKQGIPMNKYIFATAMIWKEQLPDIIRLAESIRTFGGKFADAPIWVFAAADIALTDSAQTDRLKNLGVEFKNYTFPEHVDWLYYAGKPYAAARAETIAARDNSAVLIWLDTDTIFLMEPSDFNLPENISLAYRTVMHNRAGSLYGQPPDTLWRRIYELTGLTDDMLFPMTTQADRQKIRAYFHCGLIVVRPHKGILRRWAQDFAMLAQDSVVIEQCRADVDKRVFLHQNALTPAVLNILKRDEMVELSDRYNYPLLFEKHYGATAPFNNITDVVSVRIVISSEKVGPEWDRELIGPEDKIAWLKERLFLEPNIH